MAQTIVVTGASRGIGLAIAQYLVKNGHNVVVTARSKAPLEEFRSQAPNQVRAIPGDVKDKSFPQTIMKLAESEFGRIDGLILNHGVLGPVERIVDADLSEWHEHFDINFFSSVALIQAFVPSLRKVSGRIILTSSGAAQHSYSGWGPYCASKAALKSIAETLSLEERDITTVSITPGTVDTDMQKELREKYISVLDEKDQRRFGSLKSEGKLLEPELPGNVIARLSLAATKDLSGKILTWDSEELSSYRD